MAGVGICGANEDILMVNGAQTYFVSLSEGNVVCATGMSGFTNMSAASGDGTVGCLYNGDSVLFWDVIAMGPLGGWSVEGYWSSMGVSFDGNMVALGSPGGQVIVMDRAGDRVFESSVGTEPVFELRWTHDGRYLVAKSKSRRYTVWDTGASWSSVTIAPSELGGSGAFTLHPDGRLLACTLGHDSIAYYELKAGIRASGGIHWDERLYAIGYSPSGDTISAVSRGHLLLFSAVTGQLISRTLMPKGFADQLMWTVTGDRLYVASSLRGFVFVYDVIRRSWSSGPLWPSRGPSTAAWKDDETLITLYADSVKLLNVGGATGSVTSKTHYIGLGQCNRIEVCRKANVAVGQMRDTVFAWDLDSWEVRGAVVAGEHDAPEIVEISSTRVGVERSVGVMEIFSLPGLSKVGELYVGAGIAGCGMANTSGMMFCALRNGAVNMVNLVDSTIVGLIDSGDPIVAVSNDMKSGYAVIGRESGTYELWNVRDPVTAVDTWTDAPSTGVAIEPGGGSVVTMADAHGLTVRRLPDLRIVDVLHSTERGNWNPTFNPSGELLMVRQIRTNTIYRKGWWSGNVVRPGKDQDRADANSGRVVSRTATATITLGCSGENARVQAWDAIGREIGIETGIVGPECLLAVGSLLPGLYWVKCCGEITRLVIVP